MLGLFIKKKRCCWVWWLNDMHLCFLLVGYSSLGINQILKGKFSHFVLWMIIRWALALFVSRINSDTRHKFNHILNFTTYWFMRLCERWIVFCPLLTYTIHLFLLTTNSCTKQNIVKLDIRIIVFYPNKINKVLSYPIS